jgi:hypothetical protein
MRNVRDVAGLCSLIGMDVPDVQRALAGVGTVLTPVEPSVKVIA